MNAKVNFSAAIVILLALSAVVAYALPDGFATDFTYKQTDNAVNVMKGDQVIASYVYKDTAKPYIYPLLSPSGLAVTRNFPMKEVAGEPTDHPHQKSMWIGFGDINGVDFWTEGEKSGKIVQTSIKFNPITAGPYWSIHTRNDWLSPDGKKLLEDDRRVVFYSCTSGTVIMTKITLRASVKDITLGDTKEGFFGIRLAPSMTLQDGKGKGHILNSEGAKDNEAWGKRAKWVDYTGEVNGKTVGVTVFDSHYNLGYPTYWHARDYGLLAANPFGARDFTGDKKNASPVTIPLTIPFAGSKTFTYVTLIHDGQVDANTLNDLSEELTGRPDKPYIPPASTDKDSKQPVTPSDDK